MNIEKILKFRFDSLTMHVQRFLRQLWDDLDIFLVVMFEDIHLRILSQI